MTSDDFKKMSIELIQEHKKLQDDFDSMKNQFDAFISHYRELREVQNQYFNTRNSVILKKSKYKEQQLDKRAEVLHKALFENNLFS